MTQLFWDVSRFSQCCSPTNNVIPTLPWAHKAYPGPTIPTLGPQTQLWPHNPYSGSINPTVAPQTLSWPHKPYRGPTIPNLGPQSESRAVVTKSLGIVQLCEHRADPILLLHGKFTLCSTYTIQYAGAQQHCNL